METGGNVTFEWVVCNGESCMINGAGIDTEVSWAGTVGAQELAVSGHGCQMVTLTCDGSNRQESRSVNLNILSVEPSDSIWRYLDTVFTIRCAMPTSA